MSKRVQRKPVLQAVLTLVGGATLLLLALEAIATPLQTMHIDRPGLGGHPTAGRPQGIAPGRLRVVKREFHSPQLNIDRDGFRTSRPTGRQFDDWDSSRENVLAFGGAGMFGWSVDDPETLPAQLETVARQAGLPWRVYNLGVTDYSIHDELPLLIDQLREGRVPKAVVFYDGVNETGRATFTMTNDQAIATPYAAGDYEYFWVTDLVNRGQHVNLDRSALAKLLGRLARRLGFGRPQYAPERPATPEEQAAHARAAARVYVQEAKMVHAMGESFGFSSLFVLQPVAGCVAGGADYDFPFLGPPRPWQFTYLPVLYREILQQAPKELDVVNMCGELDEAMRNGLKPFNAPLHLNREGYGLMAERIFEQMQQMRRAHR